MRITRSLLLAGTMLPALVLSDLSLARSLGDGGRIELAQREESGEGPRGGGRGPGGPGAPGGPGPAERGGVERGGPPARERPDRSERPERPEPRQAPAARERPEPAERPTRPERPASQERQERPDRQERPERAPAPAQRPDRSEERPTPPASRERTPDREAPARREAPEREAPARRDPPDRPDRDGTDRPARPTGRDRDADRPDAAPSQRRAPDAPTPPASERPVRPTPPAAPSPSQPEPPANQRPGVPGRPVAPNAQQPARPDQPTPPSAAQPDGAREAPGGRSTAPSQQPGVPGRPVAPNQQPGIPGRPVQPPGTPPDAAAPNQPDGRSDQRSLEDRRDGDRRDGDRRGDRFDRRDDDRRDDDRRGDRRDRFNVPGTPAYVPGGFRDDDYRVRDYDTIRRDRREYDVDGRTYYREPGRIIVRDRDTTFIRHDENERFRTLYGERGYRSERRGGEIYSYVDSPAGGQIITVVDDDGRLLRRSRRYRDGREVVLINNAYGGAPRPVYEDVVELPPPDIRIPRERYVVDYDQADERTVYEALSAPPVQKLDRRYTLDQVRYSPQLRARMPSVDINTITFDTGSFTVTPDQAKRLSTIAEAINRTIKDNPQEVFLIEGYTDAVGSDIDNLSLSDRRAQSVAAVLTQNFQVPPENLTTQGYGEQYLKVNTQEANRENRRVTVRRITPLLQQQAEGQQAPAPR